MSEDTHADDDRSPRDTPIPHRRLERMSAHDRAWLVSLEEALPLLRLPEEFPRLSEAVHDMRGAWRAQEASGRYDPEPLIRLAGRALGQHLVDECHLGWAMVRDSGERKPAIVDARLRVLVLPMDAVARYWFRSTSGTLLQLASELALLTRAA